MTNQKPCFLGWLAVACAVLGFDQWSKYLIMQQFDVGDNFDIFNYLAFRLAHNTGGAWSFLHNLGGIQQWIFIGIGITAAIGIVIWLRALACSDALTSAALSIVLGGALGNLIDRIQFGYVIDFIDVHYYELHWPTFNVADTFITVGAIILALRIAQHGR